MKIIFYFLEFIIIKILFIFFQIIGYRLSSNLGFFIGRTIGPIFRSKKTIIQNLDKANIKESKNPSKIASNVLGNYGRIFAEYVHLKKFRNNELKKYVSIEGLEHLENLKNFDLKKKYLMFCGIGNPHEFEQTLIKYKFNISKKIIYPDHYKLTNADLKQLIDKAKKKNLVLVTTEKDFFRLNKSQRKNIKFLKIKLEIKDKKNLEKILISKL